MMLRMHVLPSGEPYVFWQLQPVTSKTHPFAGPPGIGIDIQSEFQSPHRVLPAVDILPCLQHDNTARMI